MAVTCPIPSVYVSVGIGGVSSTSTICISYIFLKAAHILYGFSLGYDPHQYMIDPSDLRAAIVEKNAKIFTYHVPGDTVPPP